VVICLRLLEIISSAAFDLVPQSVKIDQYKRLGHERDRPMAQSGDEVSPTVL
jgi:hypothetical protein